MGRRLLGRHFAEHGAGGKDPKPFHGIDHPLTLLKRASQIARALELSVKERALAALAIAGHDAIIEYDRPRADDLFGMIRRHRGAEEGDEPKGAEGSEARSAGLVGEEMREANRRAGREVFTGKDIEEAQFAVRATYVKADLGKDFRGAYFKDDPYYEVARRRNPELGALLDSVQKGPHFFQPHLETYLEEIQREGYGENRALTARSQDMPWTALTVALADLGGAGMGSSKEFFAEGDAEFRELYANLGKEGVMTGLYSDKISKGEERKRFIEIGLGWLDGQAGFAAWQVLRFEKISALLEGCGVSEGKRSALRDSFGHFLENIREAQERASNMRSHVEQMCDGPTLSEREAFLYLARVMGYEVKAA